MRVSKRDLASSIRLAFDMGYEAGVNRAPREELRIVRKSTVNRPVMELAAADVGERPADAEGSFKELNGVET